MNTLLLHEKASKVMDTCCFKKKKFIFLNFMNFFNVRKRNQNYVIFLDDKSPKFYGNYIISELYIM